jgi:oxygen-independent coproporphyrinogen-3 oxidase
MTFPKPKRLGLYFHIPFCLSKCAYCDFFSFVPSNEELIGRYFDALIKHMEEYEKAAQDHIVDTVFIGGGTPTCVPTEHLVRLIKAARKHFNVAPNAEITIEANPATVDLNSLKKLRRLGVNRISIGLQSASDEELRSLSRIHTRRQFEQSYAIARRAGFTNINVDLMFGIPGQNRDSLMKNLRYLMRVNPEHISLYDLKIEPGTPFDLHRDELLLPTEDEEADMYLEAV